MLFRRNCSFFHLQPVPISNSISNFFFFSFPQKKKGTILEVIDLASISSLSLITIPNADAKSEESESSPSVPQESSKNLEKFLKAQKKSKIPTKENIFQISTHSGDAHQFSSSSRPDILRWAISISSQAPSLLSVDPSKSNLVRFSFHSFPLLPF